MLATVTCAIFLFCSWLMPVMTGEEPKAQRAEALAKYDGWAGPIDGGE